MIKKQIILASLMAMMLVSMFGAVVSAEIATSRAIDGKGAIAAWHIHNSGRPDTSFTNIYAVLGESNSGDQGTLYIRVVHFEAGARTIDQTKSVQFKWNMDHIAVSTAMEWPAGSPFVGPHTIDITWQALPKSQGSAPGTLVGMAVDLDGSWKAATATLTMESTHPGGFEFPARLSVHSEGYCNDDLAINIQQFSFF